MIPVIYVIHLNNHFKSREIASFDFCRIGQGLVTCLAIGWSCSLSLSCVTSVWRAAVAVGWAGQAADVSFPTQQHHTVETVISDLTSLSLFPFFRCTMT